MSGLTRDGTAEPVSRDRILRREREQGEKYFLCSADHEKDWQPYPVDPYFADSADRTYCNVAILPEVTKDISYSISLSPRFSPLIFHPRQPMQVKFSSFPPSSTDDDQWLNFTSTCSHAFFPLRKLDQRNHPVNFRTHGIRTIRTNSELRGYLLLIRVSATNITVLYINSTSRSTRERNG